MAHGATHDEVHVREHPLPGNARMFTVQAGSGETVTIVSDPDRKVRELSITPEGHDDATAAVRLSDAQATTVAALLSGVRFVVETPHRQPTSAVNLRTLTLGAASPAVGHRLDEMTFPDRAEADVIAVIRDDTPELVERDSSRPCQPGDRLVLVGRPDALDDLVQHLLG